jgi:hypothetical protein
LLDEFLGGHAPKRKSLSVSNACRNVICIPIDRLGSAPSIRVGFRRETSCDSPENTPFRVL